MTSDFLFNFYLFHGNDEKKLYYTKYSSRKVIIVNYGFVLVLFIFQEAKMENKKNWKNGNYTISSKYCGCTKGALSYGTSMRVDFELIV